MVLHFHHYFVKQWNAIDAWMVKYLNSQIYHTFSAVGIIYCWPNSLLKITSFLFKYISSLLSEIVTTITSAKLYIIWSEDIEAVLSTCEKKTERKLFISAFHTNSTFQTNKTSGAFWNERVPLKILKNCQFHFVLNWLMKFYSTICIA